MKCDDVRSRLAELALGDLDAEPARAVEEHLKSCAACRAERDSLARTADVLRAGAPLAPSTERREAAVAAMARAQAEQVEAALMRPRRSWLPWTAAAACALAVLAVLFVPSAPRLTAVAGDAEHFRAAAGQWAPLLPGDVVRPGDRLRGEARLSVDGGTVRLDPETEVAILSDGRISLDHGRVRVELEAGARRAVVIGDAGNNYVRLLRGSIEVGLKKAEGSVLPFIGDKDGPQTGPQAPRTEAAWRLLVRVAEGEAELHGSHDQRLRVSAGQEGKFSIDGQPSAAPQGR